MSILNTFETFTPSTKGSFSDPKTHKQDVLIKNLKKQIMLIDDEEIRGRRWFKKVGVGYSACIRYASNLVKLEDGNTHFPVESKERLKEVFEKLIEEVGNGDFDEILDKHWNKSNFNHDKKLN